MNCRETTTLMWWCAVPGQCRHPAIAGHFAATPRAMLDPVIVADRTLDAPRQGARYIPGLINKLVTWFFTRLLPRKSVIRIMSKSSGDLM